MAGEEDKKTQSLKALKTENLPTQPTEKALPAQPAWSVVESEPAQEAEPEGANPTLRAYAEWFAWMKKTGAPADRCHQAAQLAMEAATTTSDPVQIASAVEARLPAAVQAPSVDPLHQSYCAFYALGSLDLGLEQAVAHQFAESAATAVRQGADLQGATRTAMAKVGLPPPE